MSTALVDSPLASRIATFSFLTLVYGFTLWVLSPFLAALAWAGILAYVTWPFYRRVKRRLNGRQALAALLMTMAVALSLLAPLAWVTFTVAGDVVSASAAIREIADGGLPPLPPAVRNWPGGEWLVVQYARIQSDPVWLRAQIEAAGITSPATWRAVAGELGRNLAKFGLAVFALFFLYRHGEAALAQFGRVATHWLGGPARGYLDAVGVTVHAVVFGIVLTALAQGVLAGLGYWVAGIDAPALWGAVTALVSLIPFVGPVVWIGLSLALLAHGETNAAIGVFLWGALVVSWVDNLIRPLAISGPTRIPFLLVFLGVLGGLSAFGLIGLFLGPVLLAVSLAIWREWLENAADKSGPQ
ncbi:MAG: AI-2E family transporter [Burkholderiaceae bacterium]|nr:AI-2E family transporter [Burkholderiaceae bacterium]